MTSDIDFNEAANVIKVHVCIRFVWGQDHFQKTECIKILFEVNGGDVFNIKKNLALLRIGHTVLIWTGGQLWAGNPKKNPNQMEFISLLFTT